MSSDNLGRLVKWQSVGDGGWRTGREVQLLGGGKVRCANPTLQLSFPYSARQNMILVKESCDGRLTWVDEHLLQEWQPRSIWENRPLLKADAIIDRRTEVAIVRD